MGCDIHLYKEKKVDGKWVTDDKTWGFNYGDPEPDEVENVKWEENDVGRDYALFGFLAKGVRKDVPYGFPPRGLPKNVSEPVSKQSDSWDVDGHSHSYLYLFELIEAWGWLQDEYVQVIGQKDKEQLKILQASIDSEEETNWDLLFPFCGWSTRESDIDFEFQVPASYYLKTVERMIKFFGEVEDPWNYRFVFWFDN